MPYLRCRTWYHIASIYGQSKNGCVPNYVKLMVTYLRCMRFFYHKHLWALQKNNLSGIIPLKTLRNHC